MTDSPNQQQAGVQLQQILLQIDARLAAEELVIGYILAQQARAAAAPGDHLHAVRENVLKMAAGVVSPNMSPEQIEQRRKLIMDSVGRLFGYAGRLAATPQDEQPKG